MQWNHGYRYSLDPSLEVKKKKKEIILFPLFQLVAAGGSINGQFNFFL